MSKRNNNIKFKVKIDENTLNDVGNIYGIENSVKDYRELLDKNGGQDIKVIAKIESTQGVENFEEINFKHQNR